MSATTEMKGKNAKGKPRTARETDGSARRSSDGMTDPGQRSPSPVARPEPRVSDALPPLDDTNNLGSNQEDTNNLGSTQAQL